MSNDEECIRRMTVALRSAIEHEQKDHREGADAVEAALGALFDGPRLVTADDTQRRQPRST